ncbi:MAG: LysM peptidoglycan-binding domain-containing protein [Anaerolineae bacterium]|nr:LysM peptidoglycan-binding domain-containing protein [Anaerolineae bacterium]
MNDFERLLKQSRPQADAAFEKALEEKLVARLQERKLKMNGVLRLQIPAAHPTGKNRLSVTLAVAVMVMVLLAGIFYTMKPDGETTLPGAAGQQSATALPSLVPTSSPIPANSESCILTDGYPFYLTRPGDTLESVAGIFGVPVDAILAANCFPPDIVLVGRQMILIPIGAVSPVDATPRPESMIMMLTPTAFPLWTATPFPTATHTLVPTVGNLNSVVMTVQDIPAGTVITEAMLTEVLWPADSAPDTPFATRDALVGRTAAEDIKRWSFIQPEQLEAQ